MRDYIKFEDLSWAKDWYRDGKNLVALDFETTGLECESNRIIEFGAVRFGRQGALEEFSRLANPGMPISEEASRVNGIRDEMLYGLSPTAKVMEEFLAFLGDDPLVAHNAGFDMSFLYAEAVSLRRPRPENPVVDTRLLAKAAFPGLPRYSLKELSEFLGIDQGSAHRALDDAYSCMSLFVRCLGLSEGAL